MAALCPTVRAITPGALRGDAIEREHVVRHARRGASVLAHRELFLDHGGGELGLRERSLAICWSRSCSGTSWKTSAPKGKMNVWPPWVWGL
jgi:hypothetical protein